MSKVVMLKRAFNQAVATGAVRFTDVETDFLVIKNYMVNYANSHGAEVSTEEIESFIRAQQKNLTSISTKLSGEGYTKKVENVAITNTLKKLTKEELLKDAFDDAAANAAVTFTDKVADFLVIRNCMAEYGKAHSQEFTLEEIETYIRTQEKMWDQSITDINVSGSYINTLHTSKLYAPAKKTKEEQLKEAFADAAANPAVRFAQQDIDCLIIKNCMKEYAKANCWDLTEEEIVTYMKKAFHEMNEAVKDFSDELNIIK